MGEMSERTFLEILSSIIQPYSAIGFSFVEVFETLILDSIIIGTKGRTKKEIRIHVTLIYILIY